MGMDLKGVVKKRKASHHIIPSNSSSLKMLIAEEFQKPIGMGSQGTSSRVDAMLEVKMHPPNGKLVAEDVAVDNSDLDVVPESVEGNDRGLAEEVMLVGD